jgi:YcxB-like protein
VTVPAVPTVEFHAHFDLRFVRGLIRAGTRSLRRLLVVIAVVLPAASLGAVQADAGWVFAGLLGLGLEVTLLTAIVMTLALPRRRIDRFWWTPMPYRIGPAGVEWVGHQGVHSRLPWDAITGCTERPDRFVLIGTSGKPVRIIPRRGLAPQVEDLIRAALTAGVRPARTPDQMPAGPDPSATMAP